MSKQKPEIKTNKLTEERLAKMKPAPKEANDPDKELKKIRPDREENSTTDDMRSTDLEDDKIIPFLCEPCRVKKKRQDAVGFCETCLDFLCTECTDSHKKGRALRTHAHRILQGSEMPVYIETDVSKEVCKCTSGFVKFYCRDHKCLLCKTCKLYTHKRCHVTSIVDIADDFTDSKQFKTEMKELQTVRNKSDKLRKICQGQINKISAKFTAILDEINEIRRKITEIMDKFEDEIKRELNKLFAKEQTQITDKKVKCELLKSKAEKKLVTVEKLKADSNDVEIFVTLHKSQGETRKLQKSLDALLKDTDELEVTFSKNSLIDAFLQIEKLGELKVDKVSKAEPNKDTPVKPLWNKRRMLWTPDLIPETVKTERPKPKSETFASKMKAKDGMKSAPLTDIRNPPKRAIKSEIPKAEGGDHTPSRKIPPIKQYVSKRSSHAHIKRKAVMERYNAKPGVFY